MPVALVTGITGQDGGYLAETLSADGWNIHGLISQDDEHADSVRAAVPGVTLHLGDLADPDVLARIVNEAEPEHVFNLGGISSVAFSWEQPVLTGQVTGLGAVALLEASWRLQERTGREVRFLQASSAEIFGSPDRAPQDESTPIRPATPYGAAKAYAHQMSGVYRARGLAASTVILFNHESPRRPPTFVTRKITQAAAKVARGEQDTLALGNLDARRDWGWAPDYVDAMVRAISHEQAGDYVVATGEPHTVRDFVSAAFERAGVPDWPDRVVIDPAFVRPNDPVEQVGDPTRARTVLGWRPTVGFTELVARMVDADLANLADR